MTSSLLSPDFRAFLSSPAPPPSPTKEGQQRCRTSAAIWGWRTCWRAACGSPTTNCGSPLSWWIPLAATIFVPNARPPAQRYFCTTRRDRAEDCDHTEVAAHAGAARVGLAQTHEQPGIL